MHRFLARSEERLRRPERMAKMFPRSLSGTIQPLPAHVRLVQSDTMHSCTFCRAGLHLPPCGQPADLKFCRLVRVLGAFCL
jgi:hypothetical protein